MERFQDRIKQWVELDNQVKILNDQAREIRNERNNVSDDRLYDLLGREFANYNSIPHNTIYIKNRKKYLKTR